MSALLLVVCVDLAQIKTIEQPSGIRLLPIRDIRRG